MQQEDLQEEHAHYHISLKVLLSRDDGRVLLLTTAGGMADFPGGRIDMAEHTVPFETILEREIREELGDEVVYTLEGPAMQYRRHFDGIDRHVFVVLFKGTYVSGDIKLSDEHRDFEWIDPNTFMESGERFGKQKEEFDTLKKFFLSHR